MMGGMATTETTGNPAETLSDDGMLAKRLDHLDDGIHEIERQLADVIFKLAELTLFVDAHKPALARGLALMDPGAKVRAMLPGRKAKV